MDVSLPDLGGGGVGDGATGGGRGGDAKPAQRANLGGQSVASTRKGSAFSSPSRSPARSARPTVRRASFAKNVTGGGRASFARARSFRGLRGFSRVGGVLIGNQPLNADQQLDVRELNWTVEDARVTLAVTDSEGNSYESRPFRAGVMHQALAYAADGRPLAVTMAKATPLHELRILCHPALIDSPLGSRVIEIDRFVDVFTGESDFRREASLLVQHANRLYIFVRALRLRSAGDDIEAMKPHLSPESIPYIDASLAEAESILQDPNYFVSVNMALANSEGLDDPMRTPLRAKPEFYDQQLVSDIVEAAETTDFQVFVSSLVTKYENALDSSELGLVLPLGFPINDRIEKLGEWLKPAPQFEIWSGVREAEFNLSFDGLLPEANENDLPISFMLQVAFTSPPAFIELAEDDEYSDESPWEFPAISQQIHDTVLDATKGRAREGTILRDVSEFTVLQRFFRMAIEDRLGERFPLERLAELQQECLESSPPLYWRTLRWNSRAGMAEAILRARVESALTEGDDTDSELSSEREAVAVEEGQVEEEREVEGVAEVEAVPRTDAPDDPRRDIIDRLDESLKIRSDFVQAAEGLLDMLPKNQAPDGEWMQQWSQLNDEQNQDLILWEESWNQAHESGELASAFEEGDDLVSAVNFFTDLMQLRRSLGVYKDDSQSRLESSVPLPALD